MDLLTSVSDGAGHQLSSLNRSDPARIKAEAAALVAFCDCKIMNSRSDVPRGRLSRAPGQSIGMPAPLPTSGSASEPLLCLSPSENLLRAQQHCTGMLGVADSLNGPDAKMNAGPPLSRPLASKKNELCAPSKQAMLATMCHMQVQPQDKLPRGHTEPAAHTPPKLEAALLQRTRMRHNYMFSQLTSGESVPVRANLAKQLYNMVNIHCPDRYRMHI